MRRERAWTLIVMLSAFETEMTFALSDREEAVRALSERALVHLQRSIIVDPRFNSSGRPRTRKAKCLAKS